MQTTWLKRKVKSLVYSHESFAFVQETDVTPMYEGHEGRRVNKF